MKFGLVMYVQNEAHWLNVHLPVLSPCFDVIVAVDGGSSDGTRQVLERHGARVYDRTFDNDHGVQMNFALDCTLREGVTHVLRLDADEIMFPAAIMLVKELLARDYAVRLPRFTFEADRQHFLADVYPDWQPRAHRADVHWSGKVHEAPMYRGQTYYNLVEAPIYHYEGLHSPAYKALKHINYKRIATGEALLTRWDGDAEHRRRAPFSGSQPLETSGRYPLPEFDIVPYERSGSRVWVRNDVDRAVLHQVQTEYDWSQMAQLGRVIDIGGHAGYFSVEVKRRNPRARISVVEVEPQNFQLAQFHLRHWPDVDLHHARCGYTVGDYELAFNHVSNSSHRVVKRGSFAHEHFHPVELAVPVIRLEDLAADSVDVLKLDCEGSEIDILLNVDEAWLKRVRVIVGERHVEMSEFQAVSDRLARWFIVLHQPKPGYSYLGTFTCIRRN